MRTALLAAGLGLLIPSTSNSDPVLDQARQARAVLQKHCADCHGGAVYGPTAAEGGLSFILNVPALIQHEKKYVVPGEPKKSYLLQRIEKEEMPLGDKLPAADLEILRAWIAAGAVDPEPPNPNFFISNENLELAIFNDLQAKKPEERKHFRYFTLINLHNANVSSSEMALVRHGLVKLLNSLSWAPAPYVPDLIGKTKVIYRVDLRRLAWGPSTWELIAAANPYGVTSETMYGQPIRDATGSSSPYARADWFIAKASRPPLYHDILVPFENVKQLEQRLGVNAEENVAQGRVMRSAFNKSGVSEHNRMIERHEIKAGAYWKSYDFRGSVDRRNLLDHPLGPSSGIKSFKHDGGEMIFNLPNGFQGYFLSDASGKRLNEGPTDIVRDRTRNSAVINGISCISCHSDGIKHKQDEVRPQAEVAGTRKFSSEDLKTIKALYPAADAFRTTTSADAAVYRAALAKARLPTNGQEPVAASAAAFDAEVTLTAAAAELGIAKDELEAKIRSSTVLTESFAPLLISGGSIKRDQFIAVFKKGVVELKLGVPVGTQPRPGAKRPASKLGSHGVCGVGVEDREARIEDCADAYGMDFNFRIRGWKLVSLEAGRSMTWYEERSGLLWVIDLDARPAAELDEESFLPCQMFVPQTLDREQRRRLGVTRIPSVDQLQQAVMNNLTELPGVSEFPYFTVLRVGNDFNTFATYSPRLNGIKFPMEGMTVEAAHAETAVAFCVDEFRSPDPAKGSLVESKKPKRCASKPGCK